MKESNEVGFESRFNLAWAKLDGQNVHNRVFLLSGFPPPGKEISTCRIDQERLQIIISIEEFLSATDDGWREGW